MDISKISVKELFALQADILSELRRRGVLRTSNQPIGDLAELLFCKAFNWNISNSSQCGFDAKCVDGIRYQVKARQAIRNTRGDRQLSAIRRLEDKEFDCIAAVLFKPDFSIYRAAIIPYQVVLDSNPYYAAHDNKYVFYLMDSVWNIDSVLDVTPPLIDALNNL